MTNLTAIVRATRRSAKAIDRLAKWGNEVRRTGSSDALKRYERAVRDYHAAQAVLRANPLPGDR